MGTIQYGNGSEIHIEDRALAHLKVDSGDSPSALPYLPLGMEE